MEALLDARETLIAKIIGEMPGDHRRFLMSFKRGEPDWTLLDVPAAADLPAVRWKQQNLKQLSEVQRSELTARLEKVLADS